MTPFSPGHTKDRLVVTLGLTAFLSLFVALAALRPAYPSIPEGRLGEVRGTDQGWTKVADINCTNTNVAAANGPTPKNPPTYVSYTGCNGNNDGTACITCGVGPGYTSYTAQQQAGSPVKHKLPFTVNCNPNGLTGTVGKCNGNLCVTTGAYDCYILGIDYDPQ